MNIIILGIICSIINYLPINIREHCYILNQIFNTNIFINELLYYTPLCFIPLLIPIKKITKKDIKSTIKSLKLLIPILPIIILKILFNYSINNIKVLIIIILISLLIISIIYLKKSSNKETNYISIFFINLLSLIPGISILYTFYISIKNYNIKNKFKLSIIPFIIESIIYLKPINYFNIYHIISLITCTLLTYTLYLFFKPNKKWIIFLISIILSILYLIFFR